VRAAVRGGGPLRGGGVTRAGVPQCELSSDGDSDREGGEDSDHEEELAREEKFRAKMLKARTRLGPEHDVTIKRTLKLVGCLIAQYKLNETDELLDGIYPACKEKGGTLYIKCIQSRAFNMFKQYRFKEALEVFKEQATHCGPSAALYENMAHTYNSIGDYEHAAEFFSQAMTLLESGSFGKKGGILLGLGLVRERQGRPEEALPILQDALAHYKKDHGNEDGTSLIAKAHMSVGQCLEKLGRLQEAESHIRDARDIFRKTVGNTSPLTANALGVLGRILQAQGRPEDADPLLLESLELEVDKDAFHPDTIWRLLNSLKELWTEGGVAVELPVLQAKCRRYEPAIERCHKRIVHLKLDQPGPHPSVKVDDGTVAVIYKTAGELCMLAGSYAVASVYIQIAVTQLEAIKTFDCSSLIQSCMSSLHFMRGHLQ